MNFNFLLSSFLTLSLVIISHSVNAMPSPCAYGKHFESFALGIKHGFDGSENSSNAPDLACYDLGKEEGSNLAKSRVTKNELAQCTQSFESGTQQALVVEILVIDDAATADCAQVGYRYGLGLLAVSARTGDTTVVSKACVMAYENGWTDGKENLNHHSYNNNLENACYQIGWNDVAEQRQPLN